MTPFDYNSLDRSSRSIRLLRFERDLYPSEVQLTGDDGSFIRDSLFSNPDRDQIRCVLETYDIDHCPAFVALSYTWGEPGPERHIILNDKSFPVRENLHLALSLLSRPTNHEKYFIGISWIINKLMAYEVDVPILTSILKDITPEDKWDAVWLYFSEYAKKYDIKGDNNRASLSGQYFHMQTNLSTSDDRNLVRHRLVSIITGCTLDEIRAEEYNWTKTVKMASRHGRYWVDAICINQEDNLERNHQVGMMGDIYSRAAWVFACIDSAPPAEAAVPMDQDVSRKREEVFVTKPTALLNSICDKPYWKRMWIVQEFVLAKAILLLYGEYKLGAATLWVTCQSVASSSSSRWSSLRQSPMYFVFNAKEKWYRPSEIDFTPKRLPLESLIRVFRRNHCSDPRDRIYALLSLMKRQPQATRVLRPDYSISSSRLYYRVIGYYRQRRDDLEVLLDCPIEDRKYFRDLLSDVSCRSSADESSNRALLREALEIPVDEEFTRHDIVHRFAEIYRLLEVKRMYFRVKVVETGEAALYTMHQQYRIRCQKEMFRILCEHLGQSFNAEVRGPPGNMYEEVMRHFSTFPRDEDPNAWAWFENMVKMALDLPPILLSDELHPLPIRKQLYDIWKLDETMLEVDS